MDFGSVPVQIMRAVNTTIAASMNGTAPATPIGTVSTSTVRAWEVFNLTNRNLELIVQAAVPVTAANVQTGVFVPGTSSMVLAMTQRAPIVMSSAYVVYARTTENTPITVSATTPIYINLWA